MNAHALKSGARLGAVPVVGQVRQAGAGLEGWRLTDVDGPQGTTNREKILRIGNFLMAEKLGPGAVGGIAEIVGQFAGSIPSACGLR